MKFLKTQWNNFKLFLIYNNVEIFFAALFMVLVCFGIGIKMFMTSEIERVVKTEPMWHEICHKQPVPESISGEYPNGSYVCQTIMICIDPLGEGRSCNF